jgi:uncharacterized protein
MTATTEGASTSAVVQELHGLEVQRLQIHCCATCGQVFPGPRVRCPDGVDHAISSRAAQGTGTVFSWTVTHVPMSGWAKGRTPYVTALVELSEGLRLLAHYAGGAEEIHMGEAVEVATIAAGQGPWDEAGLVAFPAGRLAIPGGVR